MQVISGDVAGLFAYAFCDFGSNFEVLDTNGEEAIDVFICNITKVYIGGDVTVLSGSVGSALLYSI